jgi:hypothetical protein
MSQPTATASIENDINYSLISAQLSSQNETASLGYSRSFVNGTQSGAINYGALTSGTLPSGGKQVIDLTAFNKVALGGSLGVNFAQIKGLAVENRDTVEGNIINVHATGSAGLTGIFNGESGNQLIGPFSVWQMPTDVFSGIYTSATNAELTLKDDVGVSGGIPWTMIVIGVTG